MMVIDARGVTVAYERNIILKNVFLQIPEHEFVIIVGPNGAGKTTLLAMMNGLARTSGELYICGKEARGKALASLRKGIAYVPQHWPVDPRLPITVFDLILSGRCGRRGLFHSYTLDDRRQAKTLAEELGIGHLIGRPVGQLSGGEFQKATIARALFQEPFLFLLDEPTASLDWQAARELVELIRCLHEERGLTTLMVTHELHMIPSWADRVLLMRSGEIAADGPPSEILLPQVFQELLGWSPYFINDQGKDS